MNLRLIWIFCLAALWSGSTFSADCSLTELKGKSTEHPQCLFYVGTKNYREKNYAAAFGSWERLRTLKDVPPTFQELQTSANNNLGYLLYIGLGVDANAKRALQYWKVAYDAGHDEAGYHLCLAYGDADRAEYNQKLALGFCKEALRSYQHAVEQKSDGEVVQQLRKYISRLDR